MSLPQADTRTEVTPQRKVDFMRKKFAERAPVDKIPGLIKPLFGAFNVQATAENIKFYVEAVADLQPWAIEQAISDFRRGRVPEHDGNFIPKPAQVAKRALAIVDEKATKLEREKSKLQAEQRAGQSRRKPDGQTRARQVRSLAFKSVSFPDQAFMKNLPHGSKISASPLQIILPDGEVMTPDEWKEQRIAS